MSIMKQSSKALDRPLAEWFSVISLGQIKLPRFQRFEAWDRNRITSFLNTVIHNLPIGVTLVLEVGDEEKFVDAVLRRFTGRLRDARQFALDRRVILARTASGIDLDIALGALPFEENCVARATPWHVGEGIILTTCSAEDLVIHKVFASRDRDWSDVDTVLARQHGRLDLAHIRAQLPLLLELKDDVESFARLQRLIAAVEKRLKG